MAKKNAGLARVRNLGCLVHRHQKQTPGQAMLSRANCG
jgi:hypothetical protein